MKKISIFLLAFTLTCVINGQDTRKTVAVVPTTGAEVKQGIKDGITEGLQEGLVKFRQYYKLVARDADFEKALKELKFQQSGAVADDQMLQFGRALRADLVVAATISKYTETDFRISYKMIDVTSSEVIEMSSENVYNGERGMLAATDNITKKLFGSAPSGTRPQGGTSGSTTKKNGAIWNPDGIEMVYVEGTGSGKNAKGFYIGKFEVTQAQWQEVMGSNPSFFKGSNLPVEKVSWDDVQEFINKLNARTGKNYRLPTEAEWEFAAKGGNLTKGYEYSGSNNIDDVAWYKENSGEKTNPVGTKKPNELGIYDMSGNVLEWCQDWYDSSYQERVLRGGSWCFRAAGVRVLSRIYGTPGNRRDDYGFRLACSSD